MKVAFFSAQPYEKPFFDKAGEAHNIHFKYLEVPFNPDTAVLAKGTDACCIFVNDLANEEALEKLAELGIGLLTLRCAGFNQVDLQAAKKYQIKVTRVPAYSPYSVAEHTIALILTLNRRTHKAYNRVREGNFNLDGLLGFDLNGRTVGIIGLGKIGLITAKILAGFGCKILAFDPLSVPEADLNGITQTTLEEVLSKTDIVSLHCPLTPETHHLINTNTLKLMKKGVMLINTSRGALIDTSAAIDGLKSGLIGFLGLDVYEEEANLFFKDLSSKVLQDDVFARLLTFPNVLITGHQGFFTADALENIAKTTIENIVQYQQKGNLENKVTQ